MPESRIAGSTCLTWSRLVLLDDFNTQNGCEHHLDSLQALSELFVCPVYPRHSVGLLQRQQ
jgi:hypothetical protein